MWSIAPCGMPIKRINKEEYISWFSSSIFWKP
jgi:hypothetical protein